ncbi:MAG: cysteine--tRNA ligase [Acidobacteriota bacterium]|nr:cysteine--tRNA ligase [Acidobacteriota bacterium]
MLKFHNTLTNQLEEFQPLDDNKVRLYICGPTVWSYAHIGNFRTFTFGDVLRRYLKFKGYNLTHVMNLTDVDDRIIKEAKKAEKPIDDFVQPFIEAFWEDADALGLERPDIAPRATHHIAEMIQIIEKLLVNGRAYESDGSIYFRISAFPDYGKLSKINFAGNISGASGRVDTDKYDKENANDFALWKLVDADEPTGWEASFGRGRPGWHIECSAMAMRYLGETFDIHAGGIDLKFPHHENEIAQSEGATEKQFAKVWLHSEHLKVEGETMSKSLGNYYTFRDLIAKGYTATAIRYLLLSVPYHKQLNFTFETLDGAENTIARLRDFRGRLSEAKLSKGINDEVQKVSENALKEFEAAMDDNLNTSVALAALHNLVREMNTALVTEKVSTEDRAAIFETIKKIDSVMNIFGEEKTEMLDAEIESLIEERQAARRDRNFARSDEIRDLLAERGIVLEDTKDGLRWKRK